MKVYLEPLFDELIILYIIKVEAFDVSALKDNKDFSLQGTLLYTMYNYLSNHVVYSLQTSSLVSHLMYGPHVLELQKSPILNN
jgi:hypothetical protein